MLRGFVIVVMAIDHVRDYFNVGGEADPMSNPGVDAALFFTRWITHFCAPVFVFLAGTSAGLMTSRKTPSALCSSADRVPEAIKRPLIVFGRAPFAFYVAHLYFIHTLAVAFGVVQGFDAREFVTYSFFFPKGYGVGLPGVYVVWLLVVATLYPLCKWVSAVKARRQDWWLSYL